jgi:hypothetical protein
MSGSNKVGKNELYAEGERKKERKKVQFLIARDSLG